MKRMPVRIEIASGQDLIELNLSCCENRRQRFPAALRRLRTIKVRSAKTSRTPKLNSWLS